MKQLDPQTTFHTITDIVTKVRSANLRVNELLLNQQQSRKRDRLDDEAIHQQMCGILYHELHDIHLFPEDAYEKLYGYSLETGDETYAEELSFLESILK